MIENIVYKVLKDDATLANLLNANSTDSRIYAVFAEPLKLPCIVFYADSPVSGNETVWLYRQTFTFEIYADSVAKYNELRNRLYAIFQKYDLFFNSEKMESEGIIIKEAHAVESQVINTFPHEIKQGVNGVASFEFQFTKCAKCAN